MAQELRKRQYALVGLHEAAIMLGTKKSNVRALRGLPRPLGDRGIEGFEVTATPLWFREEIEELAQERLRKVA